MTLDLFPDFQCQRVFLGWKQPLLHSTIDYLVERFSTGDLLDLSDWLFVLPSAQSQLRIAKRLQARTDFNLLPPEFITSGELGERLYEPELPIAIEFEQTLGWARVLSAETPEKLRPLLPVLPEGDALGPWLEIGGTLRRLESDLASSNVTFADVITHCESDGERKRWELLSRLFKKYLAELKTAGLSSPQQQRRAAIAGKRVQSDKKILLIGNSDMSDSIAMLLRELDTELVSCVAAPESKAAWFDSLGRIKTAPFAEMSLPINDQQLIPAEDISDQAVAVSEVLTRYEKQYSRETISVGVTDESQIAPIEMQLEACSLPTYRHIGWTIASTGVGKLLDMTTQLISRPTWRSLAALVRHADFHRLVSDAIAASNTEDGKPLREEVPSESKTQDFLVQLDRLLANHLPVQLDAPIPPKAQKACARALEVREIVKESLGSFWPDRRSPKKQTIAQWCGEILGWLETVYAPLESDPEAKTRRHLTLESIDKVRQLLERFANLNDRLDHPVDAATAFEMVLGRLVELRVGMEQDAEEIQLLGWLDLALDDSDATVVCGFNHPFVPSAVTSDPFLPGTLRSKLRLVDNERRYARDAYAMQQILSTRKEVCFIVGKNSADGSPTPPSRLLAAAEPEAIARRVRSLLDHPRPEVVVSHSWDSDVKKTDLPIPTIELTDCPVRSMSVTAFKAYLECPFRFYLRYVLKQKPIDDLGHELAANQFGDLVHGAVEYFGQSDQKDETDPAKIFESLRHFLNQYATETFGENVQSAVQLQIRQAEQRLKFVADAQAERIDQGWEILWTEKPITEKDKAGVTVDGNTMFLKGRFDRIDRHRDTGQWAILDYKTHGHKPEKKHLKRDAASGDMRWIDLQLPLYRMMIPYLGIDAPPEEVQLGYFNISDKVEETRINIADFSEDLMNQADELIHDCVRRIFACDFQPTSDNVQYDDYEMILQMGVASRMLQTDGNSELEEV